MSYVRCTNFSYIRNYTYLQILIGFTLLLYKGPLYVEKGCCSNPWYQNTGCIDSIVCVTNNYNTLLVEKHVVCVTTSYILYN